MDIQPKTNLLKKIAEAKKLVGVVSKNGKVEFKSTKYSYQRAEDIELAVRDACEQVGLLIIPSSFEVISDNGNIVTTIQTFRICDTDSGEELTVQMGGMGQDTGDKRMYKAETGGYKYMMKQLFQIPAEDTDPDIIPSGAWDVPKKTTDGSLNLKEHTFKTGKYQGKTLQQVVETDYNYVKWCSTLSNELGEFARACLAEVVK